MDNYKEYKRRKLERFEREQIYANINNENLPLAIWCCDADNVDKCFQTFKRYCPQHFVLEKVTCVKYPTAPVCRIIVEYVAENDLPGEGDALRTLVQLILNESPINCVVLDRALIQKEKKSNIILWSVNVQLPATGF
ncbi:hypothetical protein QE152_g13375 [Popillia japonica]|uniref:Uncharacterized protein n=1 Tax=Popillia japonica TaxID=7064 RepID=A0AAW1LE54_POPJA